MSSFVLGISVLPFLRSDSLRDFCLGFCLARCAGHNVDGPKVSYWGSSSVSANEAKPNDGVSVILMVLAIVLLKENGCACGRETVIGKALKDRLPLEYSSLNRCGAEL